MPFKEVQLRFPRTLYPDKKCFQNPKSVISHTYSGSFDYISKQDQNKIYDQGLKCNGGWACAVVKALEIFRTRGNSTDSTSISAKNLIDCIGYDSYCSNEVSTTTFMTMMQTWCPLESEIDYPTNPKSGKGNCIAWSNYSAEVCSLVAYWIPCYTNSSLMEENISNKLPMVFELNQISFEFIHYAGGIFTPPSSQTLSSHYMAIVGYGKDPAGVEYWKLQNSFGEKWGEKGYIRISNNDWKSFSGRIIVPYALKNIK